MAAPGRDAIPSLADRVSHQADATPADSPGALAAELLLCEDDRVRRFQALTELARVLGASLNVREVFDRLADAVRPVLDFDGVSVALVSTSGRDVELLGWVDR